jgi:hypothetical protein
MPTHAAGPTRPCPTPEVTPLVSLSATARFRYAMVGCATAVVIGVGFTAAGFHQRSAAVDPSPRAESAPLQLQPAPSSASGVSLLDGLDAVPTPSPTPSSAAPTSKAPVKATTAPVRTTKPTKKPSGGGGSGSSGLPATSQKVLTAVPRRGRHRPPVQRPGRVLDVRRREHRVRLVRLG